MFRFKTSVHWWSKPSAFFLFVICNVLSLSSLVDCSLDLVGFGVAFVNDFSLGPCAFIFPFWVFGRCCFEVLLSLDVGLHCMATREIAASIILANITTKTACGFFFTFPTNVHAFFGACVGCNFFSFA